DLDCPAYPARPNHCRLLALHAFQGGSARLDQWVVDRRDPGITVTAELGEGHPHGLGPNPLDVVPERRRNRIGILGGHEPAADLGGGPGRNDRLGSGALVAAPDAVHVERGPCPPTFVWRESCLP